jgi:hypothetical protein
MEPQLPGDRADRPTFGVMQTQHLGFDAARGIIRTSQPKPQPRHVRNRVNSGNGAWQESHRPGTRCGVLREIYPGWKVHR